MSGLPSLLKSATTRPAGSTSVAYVTWAWKVPSPLPSKTPTLLLPVLATTRSSFPSPFTSAATICPAGSDRIGDLRFEGSVTVAQKYAHIATGVVFNREIGEAVAVEIAGSDAVRRGSGGEWRAVGGYQCLCWSAGAERSCPHDRVLVTLIDDGNRPAGGERGHSFANDGAGQRVAAGIANEGESRGGWISAGNRYRLGWRSGCGHCWRSDKHCLIGMHADGPGIDRQRRCSGCVQLGRTKIELGVTDGRRDAAEDYLTHRHRDRRGWIVLYDGRSQGYRLAISDRRGCDGECSSGGRQTLRR